MLQWGRDLLVPDRQVKGQFGVVDGCFNGAGTFWSRIGAICWAIGQYEQMLQWGRDLLVPDRRV